MEDGMLFYLFLLLRARERERLQCNDSVAVPLFYKDILILVSALGSLN